MPCYLHQLLAFDRQYQRDRQQPSQFLHRRDRRFALDCAERQQTADLRHWLMRLDSDGGQPQPSLLGPWRQAGLILPLIGALLGVGFMLGLLYYDGSERINITLFVALALLQSLLSITTTVQGQMTNPPWQRLFARQQDTAVLRPLRPSLAALIAQSAGLAFAVSALATLFLLVLVQDLAFSWSTTLNTSVAGYHQLLTTLALPWQSWWPAAVPGLELVAQSQFYRLDPQSPTDPALLGSWWPFLLMVWLCYALLPRLLLLILAAVQLQWRARRLLRQHPGWHSWQYRLHTPLVETRTDSPLQPPPQEAPVSLSPRPASNTLIRWAGAGQHAPLADLASQPQPLILDAGGERSLEQDQHTLEQAGQRREAVLLITRSWQPPTGELADFIDDALAQWPTGTLLAIVPLGDEQHLYPCPPALLGQWQRFLSRQQTPQLLLCAPPAAERGGEHG